MTYKRPPFFHILEAGHTGEMLTVKQEKFIQELVKGKSQRQAYKAAYNCRRLSDNGIDVCASRLMKNAKVRLRYEELRREAEKDAVDDAVTTRRKIIELYAKMAYRDPRDYYEIGRNELGETVAKLRQDFLEFDGAPIKSISYDARGNLKLEFYDRRQAAESLKDMYGLQPAVEAQDASPQIIMEGVPKEYTE